MKVELRTSRGIWNARDPESYDYSIGEIARCQSRIRRFNGHTIRPYTLAEHSVGVCLLAMRVSILPAGVTRNTVGICALLHDAAEPFVGDMPGPIKALPEMAGYRALDDRTQRAILRAFGIWLPTGVREDVQHIVDVADKELCATELRGLFTSHHEPWDERTAEDRFLEKAAELGLANRRSNR